MNSQKVIAPSSRKEWAERISFLYTKTVSAIVAVGQALIEARASLPRGEFVNMIKRDLPFGDRTAQRFMQIARHPVLADPSHVTALPPSYSTLALLASWPEDELRDALERGVITPDTERVEVAIQRDLLDQVKQEAQRKAHNQQEKPTKPAPRFTVVKVPPPAFRQPDAAAAFSQAKAKSREVAVAQFRDVPPPVAADEPSSCEPVPAEFSPQPADDSADLAALKSAWRRATAPSRTAFLNWIRRDE